MPVLPEPGTGKPRVGRDGLEQHCPICIRRGSDHTNEL